MSELRTLSHKNCSVKLKADMIAQKVKAKKNTPGQFPLKVMSVSTEIAHRK